MNRLLADDLQTLNQILQAATGFATTFLGSVEERAAAVAPARREVTGELGEGIGAAAALDEFSRDWAMRFTGSAGPRYLGFVTGGVTPAGLVGDWVTSTLDQNPTAGWDSEAPELERQTVCMMASLLRLGSEFEGAFVTGATMSNFVGLAIAREWLGEQRGISIGEEGVSALGDVTILSGAPHSSVFKAASMLGIGRRSVRQLRLQAGREAADIRSLEDALTQLDGIPCIVVANAGTVNSGDFDDIGAILALRLKYPFWLHVDAAFGAFAALDDRVASLVAGIDEADSVCVDCHKWLNVPYDSALQYSRRADLQVRVFQNAAAYLGLPADRPDFVHLTPENSRRLRALATWFSLRAYGRDGHADIVRRNIDCARAFGDLIGSDRRLRLLAPVRLNVVCFEIDGCEDATSVNTILHCLRDTGEAFLTPTCFLGRWAVRAAFSNWRTEQSDVQRVFVALQSAMDAT